MTNYLFKVEFDNSLKSITVVAKSMVSAIELSETYANEKYGIEKANVRTVQQFDDIVVVGE